MCSFTGNGDGCSLWSPTRLDTVPHDARRKDHVCVVPGVKPKKRPR